MYNGYIFPIIRRQDCNNLYGSAQSAKQPVGNYRWLQPEEYEGRDWKEYSEDNCEDGWMDPGGGP